MKQKLKVDDIEFDSLDEVLFYRWCIEAYNAGYIKDFIWNCIPYELSSRVMKFNDKGKLKMLQKEITYKPDFAFFSMYTEIDNALEFPVDYNKRSLLYFDVKGSSQKNMRSKSTSATTFPIKRAWLYQQRGILVHKILVDEWFKMLWCPDCPEVLSHNPKLCYSRFNGMKLINENILKSKETAMNEVMYLQNLNENESRQLMILKSMVNDIFVDINGITNIEISSKIIIENGKGKLIKYAVKETHQQIQEMMYDVVKFNDKRKK
jgi:hypothetical protein